MLLHPLEGFFRSDQAVEGFDVAEEVGFGPRR